MLGKNDNENLKINKKIDKQDLIKLKEGNNGHFFYKMKIWGDTYEVSSDTFVALFHGDIELTKVVTTHPPVIASIAKQSSPNVTHNNVVGSLRCYAPRDDRGEQLHKASKIAFPNPNNTDKKEFIIINFKNHNGSYMDEWPENYEVIIKFSGCLETYRLIKKYLAISHDNYHASLIDKDPNSFQVNFFKSLNSSVSGYDFRIKCTGLDDSVIRIVDLLTLVTLNCEDIVQCYLNARKKISNTLEANLLAKNNSEIAFFGHTGIYVEGLDYRFSREHDSQAILELCFLKAYQDTMLSRVEQQIIEELTFAGQRLYPYVALDQETKDEDDDDDDDDDDLQEGLDYNNPHPLLFNTIVTIAKKRLIMVGVRAFAQYISLTIISKPEISTALKTNLAEFLFSDEWMTNINKVYGYDTSDYTIKFIEELAFGLLAASCPNKEKTIILEIIYKALYRFLNSKKLLAPDTPDPSFDPVLDGINWCLKKTMDWLISACSVDEKPLPMPGSTNLFLFLAKMLRDNQEKIAKQGKKIDELEEVLKSLIQQFKQPDDNHSTQDRSPSLILSAQACHHDNKSGSTILGVRTRSSDDIEPEQNTEERPRKRRKLNSDYPTKADTLRNTNHSNDEKGTTENTFIQNNPSSMFDIPNEEKEQTEKVNGRTPSNTL